MLLLLFTNRTAWPNCITNEKQLKTQFSNINYKTYNNTHCTSFYNPEQIKMTSQLLLFNILKSIGGLSPWESVSL